MNGSDTYRLAIERLETELDRLADECWDQLLEWFPENEDCRQEGMQRCYAAIHQARTYGLAAIELHCQIPEPVAVLH
jgi:hypothetical protein